MDRSTSYSRRDLLRYGGGAAAAVALHRAGISFPFAADTTILDASSVRHDGCQKETMIVRAASDTLRYDRAVGCSLHQWGICSSCPAAGTRDYPAIDSVCNINC
jgi:hypothetical protein